MDGCVWPLEAAWIINCAVSSLCFTLRRHFFTGADTWIHGVDS
jgi:hypothetical protein